MVQTGNSPQIMSSAPVTTPAAVLPNGTAVTLHGLMSAAQYNGLTGTVTSHLAAEGRYVVVLPQGKTLSLKPANISVAEMTMNAATRRLLLEGNFRYLPPTGHSQDGSLSGFSPLAAAVSSLEASALVVNAIIAQDPRLVASRSKPPPCYQPARPSIRPPAHPSVGPSIRPPSATIPLQ